MLRLPNEAAINAACPVYLKMVQATKARQRGELDIAVQEELDQRGNPYLTVPVPPGVFANLIGLMWARINENFLTSGSLANLYLWGGVTRPCTRPSAFVLTWSSREVLWSVMPTLKKS